MEFCLHNHTDESPCSTMKAERLVTLAKERDLTDVGVTDHNAVDGAFRARDFAEREGLGINVHYGCECSIANTDSGVKYGEFGVHLLNRNECNLLMAIVQEGEDGKKFFDAKKLVDVIGDMRAHREGIVTVLNHIGDKRGLSLDRMILDGVFNDKGEVSSFFDAVELNTASYFRKALDKALVVAEKLGLPTIVQNDAHFEMQVGRYGTESAQNSVKSAFAENDFYHVPPEDILLWRSWICRTIGGIRKRI